MNLLPKMRDFARAVGVQLAFAWNSVPRIPMAFIVLMFPTLAVVIASVGILFGQSVRGWQGLAAIAGCLVLCLPGESRKGGMKRMLRFLLIVLAVFFIDGLFVVFSWWDAQAYHVPATILLARGWNPVFDSTRELLVHAMKVDPFAFNAYHVAYLPRGGWIYSAVTYLMTGNVESGDTLILFTALALLGVVWKAYPRIFGGGRLLRFLFMLLTVFAPGVIVSLFCGAHDGSLYCLMLITLLSACVYRRTHEVRWLYYCAASLVLGCNLKFTGAVSACLCFLLFTLPITWAVLTGRKHGDVLRKWLLAHVIGFLFAAVVGFSPYLTSWVHFGGPFYPQHSFDSGVTPPEITKDFELRNDDAAAMGYFGRITNAYLSKWAAHRYYEWKLNKKPFAPKFHLDQVGGLGTPFRVVVMLTLLLLCLTRRCRAPWLIALIIITTFAQPAKYVGYVRYVPQFWAFPVLVAFNFLTAEKEKTLRVRLGKILAGGLVGGLTVATVFLVCNKLIFAFGMSEYVLSQVDQMRREQGGRVYVLSLKDQYRLDGRDMEAWAALPPDLPSPFLFRIYYHHILPEMDVMGTQWLTAKERAALEAEGARRFYIGEHLFFYPRDPDAIRIPLMHELAGHPKYRVNGREWLSITGDVLTGLPGHIARVTGYRLAQLRTIGAPVPEPYKRSHASDED